MRSRSGQAVGKLILVLLFLLAVLIVVAVVFVKAITSKPKVTEPVTTSAPAANASVTPAPAAAPVVAGGIKAIQKAGEIKVGMDTGEPPWTGTPPMYFPNEKGDADGFDYMVASQIATSLGVKVRVVHGKYAELPGMLTSGAVDLIISGYSPSSEPGIAWSNAYLEYGLCLIVSKDSPVKSTNDLFGKAVGIFDDDAAAAEVQKLVKGYSELVRLQDGYWDQLLNGKFAGFIYDYPYTIAEINAFYKANPHRAGSLRIVQYNLSDSTYAVGVRTSDADLLGQVNTTLQAFRASDAYGAAIKKYLSGGLAVQAPTKAGQKVYKVKAGDTLSIIAQQQLGGSDKWQDLWKLNKDRFPNPHLIEVGDTVLLP